MIDLVRRGQSSIYGQVNDVVLKGRTLNQLVDNNSLLATGWTKTGNLFSYVGNGAINESRIGNVAFKPNTVYTIVLDFKSYNGTNNKFDIGLKVDSSVWKYPSVPYAIGINKVIITTNNAPNNDLRMMGNNILTSEHSFVVTANVFEGDLSSETLHYLSYGAKSTNSVRVKSVGKNLFDGKVYGKMSDGGIVDGRSVYKLEHGYGAFWSFKGEQNTQYTTSFDYKYVPGLGAVYFEFLYSDGTYDKGSNPLALTSQTWVNRNTKSTAGKTVVGFRQTYSNIGTTYFDRDTFQLEEGTTATEYEPYKESIVNVNLPEPLRSLPNGVKDEVNVTSGVKTQKNQKYVLQASDINSIVTTGINTDYIRIAKPADYKYYNSTVVEAVGSFDFDGLIEGDITSGTLDDLASIGKITARANSNYFVYVVAKGTYANLTAAQTALTGQALTYQLATPIVTQLDPMPITIFPNGSRWIEFGNKEIAEYADGIAISNTETPILELKKVDKLHIEDGHWKRTSISLANVTVAGDGLSLTITGAVNGEMYEVEWDYDSALSTKPDLEVGEPSLITRNNRTIVL